MLVLLYIFLFKYQQIASSFRLRLTEQKCHVTGGPRCEPDILYLSQVAYDKRNVICTLPIGH